MLHASNVFFFLLAAFILGVGLASFVPVHDQIIQWLILAAAVVAGMSAYHKTFGQTVAGIRNRRIGFLIGCLLLSGALGIYRFTYVTQNTGVLDQMVNLQVGRDEKEDIPFTYVGYVASDPDISGTRQQFTFRVKAVESGGVTLETDEPILITTTPYPVYRYGDGLVAKGAIKTPERVGEFDYAQYLRRDGIYFISPFPTIERPQGQLMVGPLERQKIEMYSAILATKHSFARSIEAAVVEPHASFLNGILLGTRQDIPDDLTDAFRRTSTSHILAISGYNIAIVAYVLLAVLTRFFVRSTAVWYAAAGIVGFVILTGASASVVRAGLMGLVVLIAQGSGAWYSPRNALVLVAGLMIWTNPLVLVFDIGFQLSFLAVIGLLYLYPILKDLWTRRYRMSDIVELIGMTIAAQIFVLPFLVYYFHTFSVVSLVANILILPIIPFTMLWGFLAGLLGLLWSPLGQVAGWIAWALSNYQINVVRYLADLPAAAVTISIHWLTMMALYALLIGWMVRASRSAKREK